MAIKVSSTVVITNALELQNIATVDATTQTTIQGADQLYRHKYF